MTRISYEEDYKKLLLGLQSLRSIAAGESLKKKILLLSEVPSKNGNFSFLLTKGAFLSFILIILGGGAVIVQAQKSESGEILYPVKKIIKNIKFSLIPEVKENTNIVEETGPVKFLSPTPDTNGNKNEVTENQPNNAPTGTKIPTPSILPTKNEDGIKNALEQGIPINADEVLKDVLGTTEDNNENKEEHENQITEPVEEIIQEKIPVNLNLKLSL